MLQYFNQLTQNNIWNIRQNKPTLIARDLEVYGVPRSVTYKVLLGRGVFKWLAVRRDLIVLKNMWKSRITSTIEQIRQSKANHDHIQRAYLRGYLKAYEECRAEVRELCHSDRFRAPDFDKEANKFLQELTVKEEK